MKFPKVIRHRKAEVTIYGKKPNYGFYRIAYRVAGKRHLRNFSKYGDALKAAEKKARELAEGSQSAGLSAKEAGDALSVRDALNDFYRTTGQKITGLQAVTGYLDAVKMLPAGHNLTDAIRGYLGNIAVVKRTDLAEAVAEFCRARAALTVAAPGKRPGLNSVYVADTARQLNEFAKSFTGTAVADLLKHHIDAFIGSHTKISAKSRNHLRSTIRMFLGWCVRRDYLAVNHRLLEADGLRKEPLDNAPIDFYRPSELRSLLEKSSGSMRAVIALQSLLRSGAGQANQVTDHPGRE